MKKLVKGLLLASLLFASVITTACVVKNSNNVLTTEGQKDATEHDGANDGVFLG